MTVVRVDSVASVCGGNFGIWLASRSSFSRRGARRRAALISHGSGIRKGTIDHFDDPWLDFAILHKNSNLNAHPLPPPLKSPFIFSIASHLLSNIHQCTHDI